VVVVAAMDAVAEEARGDQEREEQSNGGPGGDDLHYSKLLQDGGLLVSLT
jgi:hypothetical protein